MRGPLAVTLTFLVLFFGGAALGLGLAEWLAPGSLAARAVSFFALPVAFAAGLQAWYGLALLGLIPWVVTWIRTGRRPLSVRELPGAWVFLPAGAGVAMLAGLIVGWLSSAHSVWLVAPAYGAIGGLYGFLAWRLARQGFLSPPEQV